MVIEAINNQNFLKQEQALMSKKNVFLNFFYQFVECHKLGA